MSRMGRKTVLTQLNSLTHSTLRLCFCYIHSPYLPLLKSQCCCWLVVTERLRDTLIHELCHAMVWIEHKVIDGHGNLWKYWYDRSALNAFGVLQAYCLTIYSTVASVPKWQLLRALYSADSQCHMYWRSRACSSRSRLLLNLYLTHNTVPVQIYQNLLKV